jgi:adenine-specific DNA-methyltransferase
MTPRDPPQRPSDERAMSRIPVTAREQGAAVLSASVVPLVRTVVREFCSRWTPGGVLIRVSDSTRPWAYFDDHLLRSLGVEIDVDGKMPDVVVYVDGKNWLVLIEAVTSHGPVNPKRRGELKALFRDCTAGLVFVTAFLNRQALMWYLGEISWETEVWVADSPDHLIHFNGERFLGPYQAR